MTPQEYANAIGNHARQTTDSSPFPGQNFENLSEYLQQDFAQRQSRPAASRSSTRSNRSKSPSKSFSFLTVLDLERDGSSLRTHEYDDPELCPSLSSDKPMILVMRGKPSARWITTLGAAFRIDPEFFNRHLDFRSTLGRIDHFSSPSLPSARSMLFQLPYMTLGQIQTPTYRTTQGTIGALRSDSEQRFKEYWQEIHELFNSDEGIGESIVRNFYLHDQTHYALEQRISIALNRNGASWQREFPALSNLVREREQFLLYQIKTYHRGSQCSSGLIPANHFLNRLDTPHGMGHLTLGSRSLVTAPGSIQPYAFSHTLP